MEYGRKGVKDVYNILNYYGIKSEIEEFVSNQIRLTERLEFQGEAAELDFSLEGRINFILEYSNEVGGRPG